MDFSANIILDALRPLRCAEYLDNHSQRFRWVSVLSGDHGALDPELLYVCLLSDYIHITGAGSTAFVCVRDRFLPPEEEERLHNIIIVDEWDVGHVYNLLQDHLLRLSGWIFQMQQALLKAPSYQKLMDLCEDVLKNPVYALDESYSLLAHTHNLHSPDPINISLVAQGRHTDDTIAKLKAFRRFGSYWDAASVYIAKPGEVTEFESVCKWIKYEDELCVQVVIVCCNTPVTPGLIELFEVFCSYFRQCFIALYRANSPAYHLKDSLIHDLIYNELKGTHLIAERAQICGVPFRGNFNVFRIMFADNSAVLVGRVVRKLKALFVRELSDVRIIAKGYEITVLNQFPEDNARVRSEKILADVVEQLSAERLICGVSLSFTTLEELADAAVQATSVARIGEKLYQCGNHLRVNDTLWRQFLRLRSDHVYFFDDLNPYLVLHYYQFHHSYWLRNAPAFLALKRLIDYDRAKKSALVELLLAWLVCERHATAVGALLHMHRNNVLYGISKIANILELDLDDPMLRYQLLSGFILLGVEATDDYEMGGG